MKIEVVRARRYGDGRDALADLCEEMTKALSAMDSFEDENDTPVRIVLGGEEECHDWGVEADSVGFQAIFKTTSGVDGPVFDFPAVNECYVNLDSGYDFLLSNWAGWTETERASEMMAFLTTVPHELLHLKEWIVAAEGRTPFEVARAGGIEAIGEIQTAVAARLEDCDSFDDEEDAIETWARQIADQAFSGRVAAGVQTLDMVFSRARASPGL